MCADSDDGLVTDRQLAIIWTNDRIDIFITSQWRHNERDGVSNHRRLDCLLKRLFRPRSKKTSKFRITGICEGNSPVTDEFPAQRTSNMETFPADDAITDVHYVVGDHRCTLFIFIDNQDTHYAPNADRTPFVLIVRLELKILTLLCNEAMNLCVFFPRNKQPCKYFRIIVCYTS